MAKRNRAAYMRQYYLDNLGYAQACKERTKARIERGKEWMRSIKEQLICPCGEDHIACLTFHHRDPNTKETVRGGISQCVHQGWSTKRIEAEMLKCEVLCMNCHAKLHYDERQNK